MKGYLYKFNGEIYTWKELSMKFYNDFEEEEKKEKWWNREGMNIRDFSKGFLKGMRYGVDLISKPKDNELIENFQKEQKIIKECKK